MSGIKKMLMLSGGAAVAASVALVAASPAYAGAANEYYYHWEDCNRRVQQIADGQTGAECIFEAVGGGRYMWQLYTYG